MSMQTGWAEIAAIASVTLSVWNLWDSHWSKRAKANEQRLSEAHTRAEEAHAWAKEGLSLREAHNERERRNEQALDVSLSLTAIPQNGKVSVKITNCGRIELFRASVDARKLLRVHVIGLEDVMYLEPGKSFVFSVAADSRFDIPLDLPVLCETEKWGKQTINLSTDPWIEAQQACKPD